MVKKKKCSILRKAINIVEWWMNKDQSVLVKHKQNAKREEK